MGNQIGYPGKDPAEQEALRSKFFELVGEALGAKVVPKETATISQLFSVAGLEGVPAHYALVTHGCAWTVGTEFIVRFIAADDKAACAMDANLQTMLGVVCGMQDTGKFRPYETCELILSGGAGGKDGGFIMEDPLLKGTHYKPDEFREDGELHDENCWPQHFLSIFRLLPDEYAFTTGTPTREFSRIIAPHCPFWINNFDRPSLLSMPESAEPLRILKMTSPSQSHVDGLLFDLRLRKGGREVDIVFGGRWMAPFLEALHETFDKPTVPKGSSVTIVDEKNTSVATFYCHDSDGQGEIITPDTAYFTVDQFLCARMPTAESPGGDGPDLMDISQAELREYAVMPAIELQEEKGAYRRMCMTFFLPQEMMVRMIDEVRHNVFNVRAGDFDWTARPLILEWPHYFFGKNVRSGFSSDLRGDIPPLSEADCPPPARIRFACAGLEYFDDEIIINDDGEFVRYADDDDAEEEGDDEEEQQESTDPNEADA